MEQHGRGRSTTWLEDIGRDGRAYEPGLRLRDAGIATKAVPPMEITSSGR